MKELILLRFGDGVLSKEEWERATQDFTKDKEESLVLFNKDSKTQYGSKYVNRKSAKRAYNFFLSIRKEIISGYKVRKYKKN